MEFSTLSGLIVIIDEYGCINHLTDLVKLTLNVVMLLLLELLDLIHLLVLHPLSLSEVSVGSATISLALGGPGGIDTASGANNAITQNKLTRSEPSLIVTDFIVLG